MNLRLTQISCGIASILACSLLTACGGGGGGMVRSPSPSAPPPPDPIPAPTPTPSPAPPPRALQLPTPPPAETAPVARTLDNPTDPEFITRLDSFRTEMGAGFSYDPVTGIYVLDIPQSTSNANLYASTQGSLVKQGEGFAWIQGRYDGGVHVLAGETGLYTDALDADVVIAPGASMKVTWGDIVGDVFNRGTLDLDDWSDYYDEYTDLDIFGDYSQSGEGTLAVDLGSQTIHEVRPKLTVWGTATLDGTLQFDNSGYVPTSGYLEWVLYAHGGVVGQFAHWTSPGLLIDGTLRYDANNVWLELTRASVQTTMATSGGASAAILASAGNVDRALAGADAFVNTPAALLNPTQQVFLRSASRLLWVADLSQALRSLDSLAGREHPLLAQRLHQQGMATAAGIGMHVSGRRFDAAATQWSTSLAGTGQFHGFDRWLGPQWLVGGGYLQQGDGGLTSAFGSARSDDRLASAYLHYRGDAWQATAVASAARSNAQLQRRIDLGDTRAHVAHSRPQLALLEVHGELARPRPWAGGSLQPYVALDYGAARSSRFLEGGDTGFELMSDGGRLQQFDGSVGARFMRGWRLGASRLELQADVSHARALQTSGHLPAAFAGVPDVRFDLGGWDAPRASTSLQVGLQAHTGNGWLWSLHANHASANPVGDGWLLALRKAL